MAQRHPTERAEVVALILDAGVFIAVERCDREVNRALQEARFEGVPLRTSAVVLGQVWRGGRGKQVPVARLLDLVTTLPVDLPTGLATGVLIGKAGTSDPIDAAVVLAAQSGDTIMTSDPDDITHLVTTAGRDVFVLAC